MIIQKIDEKYFIYKSYWVGSKPILIKESLYACHYKGRIGVGKSVAEAIQNCYE